MPEPSEGPEYGRTAENSGAAAYPDTDPYTATRSFDAFTPAPPVSSEATWIGPPDGSGSSDGSGGGAYPPVDPPYFAYPPEPDPVAPPLDRHSRTRSVAIIAAIVLLVCGIGAGAYAALNSSSSDQPTVAATNPAAGTAAGTAAGGTKAARKARKLQTAKVTITSFNGQTLTGTTASGTAITVDITSATKYGTAAHPLTSGDLAVGDVVIVRGSRVSAGTYDATVIVMAPSAASGGTGSGTPTPVPTPTGPSA